MTFGRRPQQLGWLALFLLPGLAGLLLFTVLPILASLALTLFQWDLLTPPRFVGLGNFARQIRCARIVIEQFAL